MHLDEEQLQRLLHRELGSREAAARDHLEVCPECRYRVTEAEREESWVLERLHRLDHPTPKVSAQMVPRSRGGAPSRQRLAAGIFLALAAAAGVAYAAPGSPLPRLVSRIIESMNGVSRHQTPIPATPSAGRAAEAGIEVGPGEQLMIVFPLVPTGEATVSLTEGREVVVRALDGAAFTSDLDRLLIHSVRSAGRFEIQIPRMAPLVEIRAGGRRLFLKKLSRIVTDAPPDGKGNYRLPLSASEP